MDTKKLNKLAATYNMIPNLLWTILFLGPVYIFCYRSMPLTLCLTVLGISLIPLFFPSSIFSAIQLSKKPRFYEHLGVRRINTFAQNGGLINRYLRKKYPQFKVLAHSKTSLIKRYRETFFFEKFHFSLFLFYITAATYALLKTQLTWALVITVCNIFYNIYPNLLQQYIRSKLAPLLSNVI